MKAPFQNHRITFWHHLGCGTVGPPLQTQKGACLVAILMVWAGFLPSAAAAQQLAGTVVSWGSQMIPLVSPGTRFKAIAAGRYHSLAITQGGPVVEWGANRFGETTLPSGLSGIVAIAAGDAHNLALQQDGTVVAWGQ